MAESDSPSSSIAAMDGDYAEQGVRGRGRGQVSPTNVTEMSTLRSLMFENFNLKRYKERLTKMVTDFGSFSEYETRWKSLQEGERALTAREEELNARSMSRSEVILQQAEELAKEREKAEEMMKVAEAAKAQANKLMDILKGGLRAIQGQGQGSSKAKGLEDMFEAMRKIKLYTSTEGQYQCQCQDEGHGQQKEDNSGMREEEMKAREEELGMKEAKLSREEEELTIWTEKLIEQQEEVEKEQKALKEARAEVLGKTERIKEDLEDREILVKRSLEEAAGLCVTLTEREGDLVTREGLLEEKEAELRVLGRELDKRMKESELAMERSKEMMRVAEAAGGQGRKILAMLKEGLAVLETGILDQEPNQNGKSLLRVLESIRNVMMEVRGRMESPSEVNVKVEADQNQTSESKRDEIEKLARKEAELSALATTLFEQQEELGRQTEALKLEQAELQSGLADISRRKGVLNGILNQTKTLRNLLHEGVKGVSEAKNDSIHLRPEHVANLLIRDVVTPCIEKVKEVMSAQDQSLERIVELEKYVEVFGIAPPPPPSNVTLPQPQPLMYDAGYPEEVWYGSGYDADGDMDESEGQRRGQGSQGTVKRAMKSRHASGAGTMAMASSSSSGPDGSSKIHPHRRGSGQSQGGHSSIRIRSLTSLRHDEEEDNYFSDI